MAVTKQRHGYGTGALRVIGPSWVGSWYGADGRKIMRKVGPVSGWPNTRSSSVG